MTVVAAEAWWAEAQATALMVSGRRGLVDLDPSVEALLVGLDGSRVATPGLAAVLP